MINPDKEDKASSEVILHPNREKENKNPNEKHNKEKPNGISVQPAQRQFGREMKNNSLQSITSSINTQIIKQKSFVFNVQPKKAACVIYLERCATQHLNNPQDVIEYSSEIYSHLKQTERINKANYLNLFSIQTMISEKERRILIDWIINVHFKFDLLPETLFLAVTLLDRVLEMKAINIEEFQLLGIASMLIASKYEEIYSPEVRDFIYVTGKAIERNDILKMEETVLILLQFDILSTSPYAFLKRYHFISNDKKEETLFIAQMFLEVNLINVSIMKSSPSLQAASMLYLARKMQKYPQVWNVTLQMHSGYVENDLKPCIKDFVMFYKNVFKGSRLDSVIASFSNEKYLNVGCKFLH